MRDFRKAINLDEGRTNYLMFFLLVFFILGFGACSSFPQNEGRPARVADVVSQIKADLNVYQTYYAAIADSKPLDNPCHGNIGFYIDNVKVSLTTQMDDKTSGTTAVTLPVGSTILGLNFGGSREMKGTQTLTFTLYPYQKKSTVNIIQATPKAIDASLYPIAASLQRLRDGLLAASEKKPCISLVPVTPSPDGNLPVDSGGTYSFGFTVINNISGGAGLKFVVFSLGGANTAQNQASNTITVTFKMGKNQTYGVQ